MAAHGRRCGRTPGRDHIASRVDTDCRRLLVGDGGDGSDGDSDEDDSNGAAKAARTKEPGGPSSVDDIVGPKHQAVHGSLSLGDERYDERSRPTLLEVTVEHFAALGDGDIDGITPEELKAEHVPYCRSLT